MQASIKSTLAATLIASATGAGAGLSGFATAIWPAHPQITVLAITLVVSLVVKATWSVNAGRKIV